MHLNQVNVEANAVIKWACIKIANKRQLESMHMHHSTCAHHGKNKCTLSVTRVSQANKPGQTKKG